jgi:two-component system, OmpR family, phosphate regulon response regulator PhoB
VSPPVALVVDDDPDIRGVVVYILERAGFEVRCAPDGEAGLISAMAEPPDLVLLDWMMPGMSGVEVCRALRASEQLGSVVVIMLTAKAQEPDVQLGIDAGADDYIVKPFSPRALVEQVHAVLERSAVH